MGLYERIRDLAKLKGYSVNRLEQELGFARSSISKFNKNKPSVDKLRKISDFLDTTMENLMGTESAENDQQGSDSLYTAAQLYSGSSSAARLFESEEMINKYRESGTRDIKIYLDCRRNGACILRRRGSLSGNCQAVQGGFADCHRTA